jgi:hypothetical protein
MAEAPPADHLWSINGWQLKTGFAARVDSSLSRHFYALYAGEHFGAPARGLLAAMASAHPANAEAAPFARDAAQLLVQSFAEGFFSARRTHSPRRAVIHALAPINRWLAAQAITQPLTPVSLTALNFQQAGLGVIHIGACQLYRHRAGNFLSLTGVDAWHGRDAGRPAHAIGAGGELVVDYLEEIPEPGDRFIILAGFSHLGPEPVHAAAAAAGQGAHEFAAALLALLGDPKADAAAIVIDIAATPPLQPASDLATLPIRPVPAESALWDGFRVGKTIYRGRYTILKAAYDTIHNRDVVLKIPLKSMLTDEIFAAGFVREAWIGATVRGTAVARYIDIPAERRNSLYLVLPYYEGETLQARLNRGPPVSLPEGIGIALLLCEAIWPPCRSSTATSSRTIFCSCPATSCACSISAWPICPASTRWRRRALGAPSATWRRSCCAASRPARARRFMRWRSRCTACLPAVRFRSASARPARWPACGPICRAGSAPR